MFCILGFRKKLDAAAKKDCREWQRSILNHLYWCVASTKDGDSGTILAKWLSVDNHVHNNHQHDLQKFSQCAHHGCLSNRKLFIRRKCNLVILIDTKPSEVLSAMIIDKNLCKNILRLSPIHHTS